MNISTPIALIGCGAISEEFYLPALRRRRKGLEHVWLVEPDRKRREHVCQRFGAQLAQAVSSIDELPASIKAAFNATPSHLHLATTSPLLARGISVFLEKPLGETAEEAQKIVDAAGERSVGVNQYRRLVPSFAAIKNHIDRGDLGTIKHIVWKEGNKFAWPAQSPFYFRRPWVDGKPRGTLLDAGSHIVDLLCWWLGGELDVIDVQSDGYGGPEEFVRARLGRNGIEIDLTISMHARMPNRYSIEGTKGRIAASVMDFRRITFAKQGTAERSVTLAGSADRADIADRLVSNFVSASLGEEPLLIDAASVLPSIRTIDAAYRGMRSPLPGYYQEWQP